MPEPGSDSRSLSYNELIVLHSIAAGARYGLEIMAQTRLSSGTVYPILRRMEAEGLLSSDREDTALAKAERRPRRRLHALTRTGTKVLSEAREDLLAHQRAMGLLDAPAEGS